VRCFFEVGIKEFTVLEYLYHSLPSSGMCAAPFPYELQINFDPALSEYTNHTKISKGTAYRIAREFTHRPTRTGGLTLKMVPGYTILVYPQWDIAYLDSKVRKDSRSYRGTK